jgi:hypothetical protein
METTLASRTDLETLQNLNRDYIDSVQRWLAVSAHVTRC